MVQGRALVRHLDEQPASRSDPSTEIGEGDRRVRLVLEDMAGEHQRKRPVGGDIGLGRESGHPGNGSRVGQLVDEPVGRHLRRNELSAVTAEVEHGGHGHRHVTPEDPSEVPLAVRNRGGVSTEPVVNRAGVPGLVSVPRLEVGLRSIPTVDPRELATIPHAVVRAVAAGSTLDERHGRRRARERPLGQERRHHRRPALPVVATTARTGRDALHGPQLTRRRRTTVGRTPAEGTRHMLDEPPEAGGRCASAHPHQGQGARGRAPFRDEAHEAGPDEQIGRAHV